VIQAAHMAYINAFHATRVINDLQLIDPSNFRTLRDSIYRGISNTIVQWIRACAAPKINFHKAWIISLFKPQQRESQNA
jgi:hypothetical protein